MKAYRVSFQYSESTYCTNIARAEAVEDVEKYYSKYEWVSIKEAYEWDVEEAERKGMPIITIEHEEEAEKETAKAERRFRDTENDTVITEAELKESFEELKANGETDCENFGQYVNECTGRHGTLEEVREEGEADMTRKIEEVREAVESRKERSAWGKGVKAYALELVDGLSEAINGGRFEAEDLRAPKMVAKALLNGASDWSEYSWGGCALIYNEDIAERLCNSTELKRTRNGERRPNNREEWLDTQARALYQASQIVTKAIKKAVRGC